MIVVINLGPRVQRRWDDLSSNTSSNFVLALQLAYSDYASGAKPCEPHRSLVVPPSGATTNCAQPLLCAIFVGGFPALTSQSVSLSGIPPNHQTSAETQQASAETQQRQRGNPAEPLEIQRANSRFFSFVALALESAARVSFPRVPGVPCGGGVGWGEREG